MPLCLTLITSAHPGLHELILLYKPQGYAMIDSFSYYKIFYPTDHLNINALLSTDQQAIVFKIVEWE